MFYLIYFLIGWLFCLLVRMFLDDEILEKDENIFKLDKGYFCINCHAISFYSFMFISWPITIILVTIGFFMNDVETR